MEILSHHYNKNSVVIVYATDENYAQYLTVAIASLIKHASTNFNYEIYILSDNLCFEYCNELEKIAGQHKNIFIKVVNVNLFVENIGREVFFESRQIKMSAYYRLFIPEIFKQFSKALYLDVDTIILADVAELFNTELGDYKLGAIPDSGLVHARSYNVSMYKHFLSSFFNNFNIEMDVNYFNSGVILYNLAKIDDSFVARGIKKLQDGVKPELHDQDVLNYIGKGCVKLLDKEWNSQILGFLESCDGHFNPENLLIKNQAKYTEGAKIIHFVSHLKPWIYPEVEGGKIFWHYARKSPYYEIMLFQNIIKRNKLLQREDIFIILLMKLELLVCRLLSKIFIVKISNKYKVRKEKLKRLLRENRCKL